MGDLPVALRDARERAIALLSDRFAKDDLEMEEFDRRVTLAHRATTVKELDDLVADLSPASASSPSTALAPIDKPALVPESQVKDRRTYVAIMGGVNRQGQWTAPRRMRVFAMMGGVHLDFRGARVPAGAMDLTVFALMGGVSIIVPPGLAVEMSGAGIMGGFDHMERSSAEPDPTQPVLRVTGVAIMGGVSIETRLPGESTGEAWRRRRRERRERRAEERKLLKQ
jgi:uncharacterized protein DUF1707